MCFNSLADVTMSVYSKQINYRWAPRGLRGAHLHNWQYLSMRVAAKTAYTSLRGAVKIYAQNCLQTPAK